MQSSDQGFISSAALRQCHAELSKGTSFSATRTLVQRSFLPSVPLMINEKINNRTEKTEDCRVSAGEDLCHALLDDIKKHVKLILEPGCTMSKLEYV